MFVFLNIFSKMGMERERKRERKKKARRVRDREERQRDMKRGQKCREIFFFKSSMKKKN